MLTFLLKIAKFPGSVIMPKGYGPGDRVPVTGIYTANHHQHREAHEVFASKGESFPDCQTCGKAVSFVLAQAASHIHEDEGFRHPDETKNNPKEYEPKPEGDG